jgi:anti-sigma B factor antagonist
VDVTPPAELDPATEAEFDALLSACDPTGDTVVDFSSVAFCDSTGLRVLVDHHRRHVDAGGTLVVTGVSPTVRRVFEITGIDHLFEP